MSAGSWARAGRLGLVVATMASIASATASVAAPCRTQPQSTETLDLAVDPGPAVRGKELVVEVVVSRRVVGSTPAADVADVDVSVRLRTSRGPVFAGARTDARGRAVAIVHLGLDVPSGDAILATEAWAERTPHFGCVPAVHEHGYDETSVRVSR